jgi:hypothetical protein
MGKNPGLTSSWSDIWLLRYGIAAACIGGGQGIALLKENPAAATASSIRKN